MITTNNCKDIRYIIFIVSFHLHEKPQSIQYYYLHFTDAETLKGKVACLVLCNKIHHWDLNPGLQIAHARTFP